MEGNYVVIFALLVTSLIVRVVPSLVNIRFSQNAQYVIEEILPVTIFICFIMYIVSTELVVAPYKAAMACFMVFIMSGILKQGLFLTVGASSVLYYAIP